VAPDVAESFNIMAFVVVVLGGMGNFVGALAGGFIVGLAESLGAAFLPGSLKLLVVFAIFILVLLFRPRVSSAVRVSAKVGGALALAALVALPPLMSKYHLEILISVLFWAYLGSRGMYLAAMPDSSRSATPPFLASAPTPRPFFSSGRADAVDRHGAGRRLGCDLRTFRGLPVLPLWAQGPVLFPRHSGLR